MEWQRNGGPQLIPMATIFSSEVASLHDQLVVEAPRGTSRQASKPVLVSGYCKLVRPPIRVLMSCQNASRAISWFRSYHVQGDWLATRCVSQMAERSMRFSHGLCMIMQYCGAVAIARDLY